MTAHPLPRAFLRIAAPAAFTVASLRYALDWWATELSPWFGVYYVMPIVLAYAIARGTLDSVRWRPLLLASLIVALAGWTIPNILAYTTAQFQGWQHGRFSPERGPALADTTLTKLAAGTLVGIVTTLPGLLWLLSFTALFRWIRSRFGSGNTTRPAS